MKRLLISTVAGLAALSATAAQADTTLVVSIAADPTGLDPEAVLNNTSGFVMATIYDSLVKYKAGSVDVEPGLAESWQASEDGLTYTFHLRKGIKFHDGTPFTAPNYIKTIKRLLDKSDPDSIFNTGPVEGYIDDTYGDVTSYTAPDDYTVVFKFKESSAPFTTNLAMVWNGVVSPEAVHKYGKDFRNHPVGTGPFIFKEWRPNDQIVLDANPDYWGGKPKVDHLIFKEIPEAQAALLAIKRGDVHIMGDVGSQIIPAARQDSNLVIVTQPGLAVSGVGMPWGVKPFDNQKVRQALNYAIDRDALDKTLFQGLATPMTSPLPEAEWGFDPSLKGYPYDPAKAKELLKEAGFPNGFKTELLTYNSPRGYNSAGPNLAVAIQGMLQKVGVEASVRQSEMGAYLAEIRNKEKQFPNMFMVGWTGDNGDPDNFLYELFGSANIPVTNTPRYKNPEVDKILVEAQHEPNHDKRVALYKTAQKMILDDAPWIFVNSLTQARVIRKEVKGFQLNPTQMFFGMEKVSLEK
jgi:peptide/nickel transport system substrate-binding protein